MIHVALCQIDTQSMKYPPFIFNEAKTRSYVSCGSNMSQKAKDALCMAISVEKSCHQNVDFFLFSLLFVLRLGPITRRDLQLTPLYVIPTACDSASISRYLVPCNPLVEYFGSESPLGQWFCGIFLDFFI